MATRKNTEERLEPANLEKVIALLEPAEGKPITKKLACEMLNISYNTARLATLIEKHQEKKVKEAERRSALKGTPATPAEISYIISSYLEGCTVDKLSEVTFRSTSFVKAILVKYSVPLRARAHDYFQPELIPEGAIRDRFVVGEKVYSARYDSMAQVEKEYHSEKNGWYYRIWLLAEKWQEYAHQPAEELASLQHLKDMGVVI